MELLGETGNLFQKLKIYEKNGFKSFEVRTHG